jgi:hypothetical protein
VRWSSRTRSATPVRRLAGSTGRLFYPPAELPRQRRQRGRGSVCLQKRCLLEWPWSTFPPSPIEFTYTSVSQPAPTVIRSSLRWRPVRPPVRATRRWLSPIRRSQSYALPRYALPPVHTADSNRNGKINLTELTRVIERQNSTTTGLAPPASASTSHSLVRRMASRLGRPRSFRRRESLAPPAR